MQIHGRSYMQHRITLLSSRLSGNDAMEIEDSTFVELFDSFYSQGISLRSTGRRGKAHGENRYTITVKSDKPGGTLD